MELVRRGLVSSRQRASEHIGDHRVLVGGVVADKAARQVSPQESVEVLGPPDRFVGRGGEKLDAALDRFGISAAGARCLDAGASVGGFTDCLLQRGAVEVLAVDVGRAQLHERLRGDDRVRVMERTNVRHLRPEHVGGARALIVADLSFISLRTVLPTLVGLARPGAEMVLLVKPQFEAGRAEASRGRGVITDPAVWRQVLGQVGAAGRQSGAAMMDAMVSPLLGAEGNVELFAHLRAGAPPVPVDLDAVIVEAQRLGRG